MASGTASTIHKSGKAPTTGTNPNIGATSHTCCSTRALPSDLCLNSLIQSLTVPHPLYFKLLDFDYGLERLHQLLADRQLLLQCQDLSLSCFVVLDGQLVPVLALLEELAEFYHFEVQLVDFSLRGGFGSLFVNFELG